MCFFFSCTDGMCLSSVSSHLSWFVLSCPTQSKSTCILCIDSMSFSLFRPVKSRVLLLPVLLFWIDIVQFLLFDVVPNSVRTIVYCGCFGDHNETTTKKKSKSDGIGGETGEEWGWVGRGRGGNEKKKKKKKRPPSPQRVT